MKYCKKTISESDIRGIMTHMLLYHWVLMKKMRSIQAFQFGRLSHTNGLWSQFSIWIFLHFWAIQLSRLHITSKTWCLYLHCVTDDSNMQVLNCTEEIILQQWPLEKVLWKSHLVLILLQEILNKQESLASFL